MITLRNILVATDFSEPSDVALKYGRAFAEAFPGATLHILHVMEDVVAHAWVAEVYVSSLPGIYEEIERASRERLNKLLTPAEREQGRTRLVLRNGVPFAEITQYAEAENIDLIIMGTHGRGALAHMMMGSVAEKVVRKAPCPVLTVRTPEHEFITP